MVKSYTKVVTLRYSLKKGVLANFAKLKAKHLCQSLFFNKVAGCETFKNIFFIEHLRWLLLSIVTGIQ